MISKRIGIEPKNDNYARLAVYIADAGHESEKALLSWCSGCFGDDDYAAGMEEAMKTQAMNTRAGAKTYHLVVSFRPSDESNILSFIYVHNLYKFKVLSTITIQERPRKSLDN